MTGDNRRRSSGTQRSSTRGYSSRGGGRTGGTRSSSGRSSSNGRASSSGGGGANVAKVLTMIVVVLIVVVLAGGAFAYVNLKYLYDETTIIPGVEVDGVNLGGMTREEAFAALTNRLNGKIDTLSITLKSGTMYGPYGPESVHASGDVSGILDEAMLYGHRGDLKQRMDEAKYVLENPETFTVSFGYNTDDIRNIVETLKKDIDIPVVEPTLVFDKEAGQITGIEDRTALEYNPLKYDTSVNINGQPAEIYVGPDGNYHVAADIFSVTPGSTGYEVDVDATVAAIVQDLADDYVANVDIVLNVIEPTLTEEQALECTALVYHSKSGIAYTSDFNRDRNIDVALSRFDGLEILPGQTVSFNETTGPRTAENGFFLAPGIAQDKSHVMVYGGGVCQAATIIFNAAIMSGMTILDKDSHSWPLYTALDDFGTDARDAMVNWGTSDLVFRNDTDYPIYFDTYVYWYSSDNATYAYCNAYTKLLPDGKSIKYEPRLVETRPAPEPRYVSLKEGDDEPEGASWKWDKNLKLLVFENVPSKPYKYYEVYQQILDANGNVISEQMWYKALYEEIQGQIYTKPDPSQEEVSVG
ncbi:MAG: VanW family protein [Eubacteriales bacterium]